MVQLYELMEYCDTYLQSGIFKDYAPNGLQVEACHEIETIITGVTASQALIDAAIAAKADLLLVHHGYFWKGEPEPLTGIKGRRIAALIRNNISLAAYHLPLDAHPEIGNNAQLANLLGFNIEGRFGRGGDELGMYGELTSAMLPVQLKDHLQQALGREPLHLAGASDSIKRIAWCSGAAQSYIEAAERLNVDAFISGEVSEYTTHFVRETGIHYFAAGHHATERYGIKALGEHLSQQFGVMHRFIDIANPV